MGISSHISNIRSKPEHVRRRFAFWYSFGITAIIFAFWLSSFSSFGAGAKGAVAETVDKAGTPAQSLIAGVGEFAGDIKELIFGAKEIKYGTVQVLPGR